MTETDMPARRADRTVVRPGKNNRWNEQRRQIFLTALAESANVSHSAGQAGMSLSSAYLLKKRNPAFALKWLEALEVGFCEVELSLLRQSLKGTERIETMVEGEAGKVKYVKTTRSYPFSTAIQLLLAHRDEVQAYRMARDGIGEAGREETEEEVEARVRAHMDEVRGRLIAQGIVTDMSGAADEGDEQA